MEKKKPFRGDDTLVSNIIGASPVQFKNVNKNSGLAHLPEFMIIQSVQEGYAGKKLVYYSSEAEPNYRSHFYCNPETKFKVLTGKRGRDVMSAFDAYRTSKAPATRIPTTTGADPEIFVYDENSEVIPSWQFLKSKEEAMKDNQIPNGGNNVYWDGFQGEFDVIPGGCHGYFFDSVQQGLVRLLREARAVNHKAKLSNVSVIKVKKEILETAADQHVQFGCMPSLNAYGLKGIQEDGRRTEYRFAGGHIHIGLDNGDISGKRTLDIVKAMDAILGVACVSLFAEYDFPVRRQYYGMAGEYRRPKHGIEYRVLSNGWLMHPTVANMVFDLARIAVTYGYHDFRSWKAKEDNVIGIIQDCNVDGARALLTENKNIFEDMFKVAYNISPLLAAQLCMNGIEKFVQNPSDIEGNWRLSDGQWIKHCETRGGNWWRSAPLIEKGQKI